MTPTLDRSASVSPVPRRVGSDSSEYSEPELDDEEARSFFDAHERLSADDMICDNCAARTFNAFKVQSGPQKGETKLRCSVYVLCCSYLTLGVNMYSINMTVWWLAFLGFTDHCNF